MGKRAAIKFVHTAYQIKSSRLRKDKHTFCSRMRVKNDPNVFREPNSLLDDSPEKKNVGIHKKKII